VQGKKNGNQEIRAGVNGGGTQHLSLLMVVTRTLIRGRALIIQTGQNLLELRGRAKMNSRGHYGFQGNSKRAHFEKEKKEAASIDSRKK